MVAWLRCLDRRSGADGDDVVLSEVESLSAVEEAANPATTYVGRQNEIAQVKHLLSTSRLVTLTGTGGVGKTRLALMVAESVEASFPNGVVHVELAALTDAGLLPNTFAAALGLQEHSGSDLTTRILTHLRRQVALVVVDNCEHILNTCTDFIRRLISSCPDITVLATSRQALGIETEYVMTVMPLSLPPEGASSPAELASCDSLQLFLIRAKAADPSFQLQASDLPALVELCRRLEGLPLAIELAAARVRSLSPRQIADRIDVEDGRRSAPAIGLACDYYPAYPPSGDLGHFGYINECRFCYRNNRLAYKSFTNNDAGQCGYGASEVAVPTLPLPNINTIFILRPEPSQMRC